MAATEQRSAGTGRRWYCIRNGGVMVVVEVTGDHLPAVVYWGADLGQLAPSALAALPMAVRLQTALTALDRAAPLTVSPARSEGWVGWPALAGSREGQASQPLFRLDETSLDVEGTDDVLRYGATDAAAGLRLGGELHLSSHGVLKHRQTLTSLADAAVAPYEVEHLTTLLPVPDEATDVVDFAGRWANEAQLQRRALHQGTWLREQRRGRTGPDTPLLLGVGTEGFGMRHGEVWGVHLGWSGDQRYMAQRLNTGTTVIGAGEILAPGEVLLGPGDTITTPWTYGLYSERGLDGASARIHAMLRDRPGHPTRERPVLLNTWEAVYFEQSFERLAQLADVAAGLGVERFVIDDGWFGSRRDDRSGLGDWSVSPDVWPDGLGPIAEHVRSRGMQFGLWFEPEMVNPDSDMARAHPGWVLGTEGRMPPEMRHQQVLDVSIPEAFGYLLSRMSSLVAEYGIEFVKWDHNRDLFDPVHRSGPRQGLPAVRDQTLATYALMDELRRRHPGLEIESCSSGGSRIDLGVVERTDRVWASDCIDPIERVRIVQGIATLLPLELIGTHVASGRSATTGRQHDLELRLVVALFGHHGIEWDVTKTTAEERRALGQWVSVAKSLRPLLHRGELVRADRARDPGTHLFGVVAHDRSEALFALVRSATAPYWGTPPLRLGGLDPGANYGIRQIRFTGPAAQHHGDGAVARLPEQAVPGALLMGPGLEAPWLNPDTAALFHLKAEPG